MPKPTILDGQTFVDAELQGPSGIDFDTDGSFFVADTNHCQVLFKPDTSTSWQNWYPAKGISGNHLGAEVLGSLFGKHPAGRYWTNTTYKLWGTEFMATMTKYARGNKGTNHHIVQAGYTGINILAAAAKAVGPNLTRDRLMTQLANGTVWHADASMSQRFSWKPSERLTPDDVKNGTLTNQDLAQGREFMYKYTSSNTVGNPDGSPSGFAPDPDLFVITTAGKAGAAN